MTINCQQFEQEIDDLLDNSLPSVSVENLKAHLNGCANCRKLLNKETEFRLQLASLRVPAMRANFPKQAFIIAKKMNSRQSEHATSKAKGNRKFMTGLGYALATGVIAWMGAAHFYSKPNLEDPIQTVSLSVGEVKKVNLVFHSPEALSKVTVSINLPGSTEIHGRSGVKKIEWETSLQKGKNIITLPVLAQQEDTGDIVTRISSGSKGKVFRVRLNIGPQLKPIQNKALFNFDVQPKGVLI